MIAHFFRNFMNFNMLPSTFRIILKKYQKLVSKVDFFIKKLSFFFHFLSKKPNILIMKKNPSLFLTYVILLGPDGRMKSENWSKSVAKPKWPLQM